MKQYSCGIYANSDLKPTLKYSEGIPLKISNGFFHFCCQEEPMQQTSAGQDLAGANEKACGGRGATVMSPQKPTLGLIFDLYGICSKGTQEIHFSLFDFSTFREK